ncbi:unnamed protein product [Ectocarpus sp. 12 AP-2014]
MEFGEDSPAFRRKVETLDSNVEGLRGQLQQLVAVARKYCGNGLAFCEHGRELAGVLMNPRGESWFTRLGPLAPALEELGRVLGDIQGFQEDVLLRPLENAFYPMEDFVKGEVKTIRKMKQEMNRSCEDYEHSMARFLQLKRNSEEGVTQQARAAEVALSKKKFEMARFDFVHHLSQLETKKKHEVVGRTCTALHAFLALFERCNGLVASTEQRLRELECALTLSRQASNTEDGVWLARRDQLEASLTKAIPPNAALVARSGGGLPPAPSPTRAAAAAAATAMGSNATTSTWPSSATSSTAAGGGMGSTAGAGGAAVTRWSPGPGPAAAAAAAAGGGVTHMRTAQKKRESLAGSGTGQGEGGRGARERRRDSGARDGGAGGGGSSRGALWSPRQDLCIKGGYLWKRSTNVRKDWQRRYFFIQNGKLFYQRQETFVSPAKRVCDIKLCHVRSCLKDTDLRFSFEIISPQRRTTYLLQAEDEDSHQQWVAAIKSEIERLLSSSMPASADWDWQSPNSSISTGTFTLTGAAAAAAAAAAAEKGEAAGGGAELAIPADMSLNKAQLTSLWEANPECVDCGAREPDWSSINLGVMMCIECSGIHRSMGVHVSKVRSLTLDRWTTPLVELLLEAGNHNANEVWEAHRDGNPAFSAMKAKLYPEADRAAREAFIRAKYEQRRFVDPPHDMSPEAALSSSRLLFDACKEGNMVEAMWCLAHGADVNWTNTTAGGYTAAHEAARGSRVALLELLANNGCDLSATSENKETPLDLAGQTGSDVEDEAKVVRLLLSKQSPSQSQALAAAGSGGGSGAAGAATAAAKAAQAFQQQQQQQELR